MTAAPVVGLLAGPRETGALSAMHGRDLLKQFKDGPWSSPAQIDQLVASAEGLTGGDLLKLFEVLGTKAVLADPAGFRLRAHAFSRLVDAAPDPALFLPLVRSIRGADHALRMVVVSVLPKVNHPPSHPELCALLRAPEPAVRKAASAAISQVGGKAAIELLAAMIKEPSFGGRIEATDSLVHLAAHRAIPSLHELLRVGSPGEKTHALKHLSDPRVTQKDAPGAVRALAEALDESDPRLQVMAIQALGQIASEDEWQEHLAPLLESKSQAVAKAAVESLRRFATPRTVRTLDRAFRMGPGAIRLAVVETAEAIGDEIVLPLLVSALDHKSLAVRTRAGHAITHLSQSGSIDVDRTVMSLLKSRDAGVRRLAVDIASRVTDPRGELWPKLVEFLRDEDWWVRERVTDALIEMAGRDLTRLMVGYLADPAELMRRYAVTVLGRLRDPGGLGALVRTAREDADWWVRESAIEAISALGDERAVPYLLDIMAREPQLRRACVVALRDLGAPSAAAHVAALIPHETEVESLLAIVDCLANLGDPSLAEAVSLLANEPDHRLRQAVRELLERWRFSQTSWVTRGSAGGHLGLLDQLLFAAVRADADDLILEAGRPPYVKQRGKVLRLSDQPVEDLRAIIHPHLSHVQVQALEALKDVDLSYAVKSEGLRFRVNVYQQMTGLAAVFRVIKDEIPQLHTLHLPEAAARLGDLENGLVLVGGPASSGKSTTLAALIDDINRRHSRHIVTLEDPIEVVHAEKKSHVTQREIGTHSRSFAAALKAALREDPDVILVGEMRDLATISLAVTAAETGHLVFGTLHTVSADSSIERLINAFPAGQQPQVRSMLASSLRAVLCQQLLPRLDGLGRIPAVEVLLNNDAVANLIRRGKTFQIPSIIATSRESGMQTMDSELMRLVKEGLISGEEAYAKATSKKDLEPALKGELGVAPSRVPTGIFNVRSPSGLMPGPPRARSSGVSMPSLAGPPTVDMTIVATPTATVIAGTPIAPASIAAGVPIAAGTPIAPGTPIAAGTPIAPGAPITAFPPPRPMTPVAARPFPPPRPMTPPPAATTTTGPVPVAPLTAIPVAPAVTPGSGIPVAPLAAQPPVAPGPPALPKRDPPTGRGR